MADIFRSAFSYISQTGKADNDFVGQYVELGPIQLRVKKVLAEGNEDASLCRNVKTMMLSVYFVVCCRWLWICVRGTGRKHRQRLCVKGQLCKNHM